MRFANDAINEANGQPKCQEAAVPNLALPHWHPAHAAIGKLAEVKA